MRMKSRSGAWGRRSEGRRGRIKTGVNVVVIVNSALKSETKTLIQDNFAET